MKTRFKELLIITITILGFINAGNLMPDPQNPILVTFPNTNNLSTKITARFCLDPKGSGLGFNQVIGLVFPIALKTDLNFDTSLKYTCSLMIGTKVIKVNAIKAATADEGNIAYCQLTDQINTMISPGENLTLNFDMSVKFTTNWVRGMRLFTATSNKASKLFIDSAPYIGSLAFYGDANTYSTSNAVIEMSSPSMLESGTSITSINPEKKFDVSINITSKIFLNRNDFLLTFKFDDLIVKAPTSVISTKISSGDPLDKLSGALTGDLITVAASKDMVTIGGIGEDLVPGRKFTLLLKGFVAQSLKTSSFSALEMNVYYKNTYSLLVTQKTISSSNIFTVNPNVITLTANHPDLFDIFRSGLYPTRFTFKTANDINTPMNILIQHANAKKGKNEFSFVASTCDFSENDSSFTQAFGARPVCNPYRTDFAYTGASTTSDFDGSGLFFSLKSMKAATTYYLTVWGSADNCGGDEAANFAAAISDSMDTTKTKFKFSLTAFNGIDETKVNELRLSSMPKIAQTAAPVAMGNVCWNAMMNLNSDFLFTDPTKFSPALAPFEFIKVATGIKTIDSANNECDAGNSGASAYCRMTNDINLYREFTNIKLINHSTVVPSGNYLGDLAVTANVNNAESYLYGTTTVSSSSYFALIFDFHVIKASAILEMIPSPVAFDTATVEKDAKNKWRVQPGRLEFKFQKQWFTTGDSASSTTPGCYIGWGITDTNIPYSKNVMRNFATPADAKDCATTTVNGKNNFLTSFTNTGNANNIDCSTAIANLDITNSSFPTTSDSTKSNFRILSTWNSSGPGPAVPTAGVSGSFKTTDKTTFNWPVETDLVGAVMDNSFTKTFGLFSSCLKFNTAPTTIKSLYASMDIQINYLYNLKSTNTEAEINNSVPHRAIRLIKLFPEGGVFQDVTSSGKKVLDNASANYPNAKAANGVNRSSKLHYALGASNTSVGVCLIEIYGAGLGATADQASTVLGIWIGFGVILETDYNDLAATYPLSPLSSTTVSAYGLQSGYNMNMNSNFYNHKSQMCSKAPILPAETRLLTADLQTYAASGCGGIAEYDISFTEKLVVQNYRSSYYFLMGSLVLVKGIANGAITTNSNADNLLIPIYCPIQDETNGISHLNGLPTLYMAFLSMTAFNSITSVNKIFSQKINTDVYTSVISPQGLDPNSYRDTMTAAKVLTDSSKYHNYLFTLRWAAYSSTVTDNDSILYLYYGSVNENSRTFTAVDKSICTGYVLLLQDSIIVDNTKLKSTILNTAAPQYYNNGTKKFYYLGNSFTKSLTMGFGNALVTTATNANQGALFTTSNSGTTSLSPLNAISSLSITGIKRPNVQSYWDNKTSTYTGTFNSLAFFCGTYTNDIDQLYTNYLPTSITSTTSSFIVDFNPLALTSGVDPKVTVTFSKDKSGDVYFSDVASNSKISLTLPYVVPGGWILSFSSSNSLISADSMCGIIQGTSDAIIPCTNASNSISCLTNSSSLSYQLCCYNLKTSSTDTFTLNNLKVQLPAAPSAAFTFNTVDAITVQESFPSTASMGVTPAITTSAKIASVSYSHVVQDSGIGKLTMKITLPRDPVRNMLVTVAGDLVSHQITNITPRCSATFGSSFGDNWNLGDILLDTCNVTGLNTTTSPIIVTTKNMIYKCGLSFSSARTLTVMLWPVRVANWGIAPYSENTYTVKMQLNTSSPIDIAINTSSDKVSSNLSFLAKPLVEDNLNLCNIQKVTPLLPGELAEWIFDFDLDFLKDKFVKSSPNEVSIFFDYGCFGGMNDNVICKYEGATTSCAFSDEGILNIRFSSDLKIGSGKKISISVINITNPTVYTDIFFTCTVNNLNGGVRTNIITGQGKLTDGIKLNGSLAEGALRFVNTMTVSDSNPRNTSIHTFRITFDDAVAITVMPISIANNPKIIVTFPSNYKFGNFPNTKYTCLIDEYLTPENTTTIVKSAGLSVKDCLATGNTITVNLFQAKYTFGKNFRYWDLKIQNVVNPDDTTSPNGLNSTGQFTLLMTNDDYSSLYRSYQNLNSAATNSMSTAIDSMIGFNRGLEFKFDNTKWVIDFMDGNNKNMFNIKPGRFMNASLCIRNSDATAVITVAEISLDDNTFKLSDKTYTITPVIKKPVPIYIGVPCSTLNGRYLINFSISEVGASSSGNNYAPLIPILAIVDNSAAAAKASIIMSSDTIPIASTLAIRFNIPEPNVDDLTITFSAGKGADNDVSATLSETKIPKALIKAGDLFDAKNSPIITPNVMDYSLFSITSEAKTTQSFVANDINKCYSWVSSNVSVNFSGNVAKLTDIDYTASFNYINSVKDKPVEMNALKFTFTPTIFPIYLYCALVCNNKDFPTDDTIIAYKTPSDSLTQYYMGQFMDKTAQNLVFKGLIRNMIYKMRCIIKTTSAVQGNGTQKAFNYVNSGNSTPGNNSTSFVTEKSDNKTCIQYSFNEDLSKTPKQKLVEYCQKMFTEEDWAANGCIICSDSLGNILSPGISMPTGVVCKTDAIPSNKTLRFLQDAPSTNSSVINPVKPTPDSKVSKGPYPYTVCATPSPKCATNVNKLGKEDSSYVKVMLEYNKRTVKSQLMNSFGITNSTFNASVLFSDDGKPDISKVEFSVISSNKDGSVVWQASASSVPMNCFWSISEFTKKHTAKDIINCTQNDWCGKNYQIGAYVRSGQTNPNAKKAFVSGQQYDLNFVCSKDVPSPMYYSDVKSVSLSVPNTPSQDQKSDVTPTTNSTVDPNSSAYLSMNYVMILNFILLSLCTLF